MKFFHDPRTCSMGIRVLLEEAGAEYETVTLDLSKGEQRKPEFRAINPKGKVPSILRPDGKLLTEFPAIAYWIARSYEHAGLLPDDIDGQTRALELMDFIVSTVHMRGITLIKVPQKFTQNEAALDDIRAAGAATVNAGLEVLSDALGDQNYLLGQFSIADAALYYLMRWDDTPGLILPKNLTAHRHRMETRPAVQRAIR